MKDLRKRFDRFCFKNRDKGIPNLMLYIVLGNAVVYFMSEFAGNYVLYDLFFFDRNLILQGQVWRLFTYAFTFHGGNVLFMLISLVCYFSLGRAMENYWGTCKFTLFYLSGILMMDIYGMIFNCGASVYYLNLSLFLAYATLYPESQFLLFFIIPVKARYFALFDLVIVVMDLIQYPFPFNLFPVIALANYFLFFGKDVLNVIPPSWRINARRLFRRKGKVQQAKVVPFPKAGSYQATVARPQAPYTHRCSVCGRTDVSNPELEFRYCSRCSGYHCYCQEHISNHTHIQ